MKYPSDQVCIYILVLDSSGSMKDDEKNVRDGIENMRKSLQGFPESKSIGISISYFNETFRAGEFSGVQDIKSNYRASGETALYKSIEKSAEYLLDYLEDFRGVNRFDPSIVTYIFLSDGVSSGRNIDMSETVGKKVCSETIKNLNMMGITTAFAAFGDAIGSNFGKMLGFQSTIDINDRGQLLNFLGNDISQTIKTQSQRLEPLGANFFSQAAGYSSPSEGYSNTTQQVLDDDSWIDDI